MENKFSKLSSLVRLENWWHYKIPPLITIFFSALTISALESPLKLFLKLPLLVIWMSAAASLGYFINDWCDIDEDLLAGKKNKVASISARLRWLIVTFLFFATIIPQYLLNGIYSIPFVLSTIQIFLFLIYSVPIIRLKQYLLASILCDSFYAHLLPAAIVFTSICTNTNFKFPLIVLCFWQFVVGLRNISLHHIFDRKNDAISGNKNLANWLHPRITLKTINQILIFPDLALAFFFFSYINEYLALSLVIIVLMRLVIIHKVWRIKKLCLNKKTSYWLANDVYEGYMPFISILVFAFFSVKHSLLLCLLYPFVFPLFMPCISNDIQYLVSYLKSISLR